MVTKNRRQEELFQRNPHQSYLDAPADLAVSYQHGLQPGCHSSVGWHDSVVVPR